MKKYNVIMFNMSKYSDWTDSGVVNRNYHILHNLARDERIEKIIAVDFLPFTWKRAIKTYLIDIIKKDGRGELVYGDLFSQSWQITSKIFVFSTIRSMFSHASVISTLKKVIGKLGMENNLIVYSCNPMFVKHLNAFDQKVTIFDAIDNWVTHSSYKYQIDRLMRNYEQLDKESDLIYTVSQDLAEQFNNPKTKWLPNAVDFDHFQTSETIEELSSLNRPIIGFLGILQDRIDTELIKKIAQRYEFASIVLAGPVWKGFPKEELSAYKNIIFSGPVSYRNIPKFYNTFDVGIITYKNSEFIKSTNSMKYYEYLASGLPVVSTWSGGIEKFNDVMYISHDDEEFLQNIKKAFDENTPALEEKRKQFVSGMTWKSRVDEIMRDVEDVN